MATESPRERGRVLRGPVPFRFVWQRLAVVIDKLRGVCHNSTVAIGGHLTEGKDSMSAYVVSGDLIDLIVTAGIEGGPREGLRVYHRDGEGGGTWHTFLRADGHTLAQILHNENVRGVNSRYGENTTPDAVHVAYVSNIGGVGATWGDVLRALACYEYQAGESVDYDTTLAAAVIAAIRAVVVAKFIPADSPWEWSREHQRAELDKVRKSIRESMKAAK